MTRTPRLIGYALLALSLAVLWGDKSGAVPSYGPFPAMAVGMLLVGIGVMLVFTDLMVRGLYAQVGAAKAADTATDRDVIDNHKSDTAS